MWGTSNATTNLSNLHTCAARGVDLISTLIPVPHGELFQLTSEMVRHTGVGIPIGINVVGGGCSRCRLLLLDALERGIKTLVTPDDGVTFPAT